MTASSPLGLIISAASDPAVQVDRLVRATQVVATSMGDAEMAKWCSAELDGTTDIPDASFPEYRRVPAQVMVTDHFGRDVPTVIKNVSAAKALTRCPIGWPLAQVQQMATTDRSSAIKLLFEPEHLPKMREMFPGAVDVFRVVQNDAFATVAAAVRQRVFAWAMSNIDTPVTLPAGLRLEALLGGSFDATPRFASKPMEAADVPGLTLSISQLSNSAVVVNSPGGASSVTQSTPTDMAALRGLVSALAEAIEHVRGSGQPASALAQIEGLLDELKALSNMKAPRYEWVRTAAGSVKAVLEQAAGSILGGLATPQVQALLAQVLKG